MSGPLGFEPRPHITEQEFTTSIERILIEEFTGLVDAGLLNDRGLLAIRSRLVHSHEFRHTAGRDLLVLKLRDAYAASRGIDPSEVPLEPGLAPDDDASGAEAPREPEAP